MANAASEALNAGWSDANVLDVVVAIPFKLHSTDFNQFGDGQTNAWSSFESWAQPRPPVVATLTTYLNGARSERVRLDRALPFEGVTVEIVNEAGGGGWGPSALVSGTRAPSGELVVDVPVQTNAGATFPMMLIRPVGWNDWFLLQFRTQVTSIADLVSTVPETMRAFADLRPLVDPMDVSVQGATVEPTNTVLERLQALDFGGRYTGEREEAGGRVVPCQPEDIHGRAPVSGRYIRTAVGGGWTWVANPAVAPFKVMYTGFSSRQADREAAADSGVPSGAGWHRQGSPGQSMLNSLEDAPLVMGFAQGNPLANAPPPSGALAYGLTDVATMRWLHPGEAFVTPRGTDAQPIYKTYLVSAPQPFVTEEWIHPWEPPPGMLGVGPRPGLSP